MERNRNKKYEKDMKKNIEDLIDLFCNLPPELHSRRVTRSFSKVPDYCNNFITREDYRCMPLLGNEDEVPNWEAHVAKYSIVFV